MVDNTINTDCQPYGLLIMNQTINLDAAFSALGDSTRRAIVERLMKGETALSELAAPFEISQTAVSKHVSILMNAGLVSIEKRGRVRHCQLRSNGLEDVVEWISDYQSFWKLQFGQLSSLLSEGD